MRNFGKPFYTMILSSILMTSCGALKDTADNAKQATKNSGRAADAAEVSADNSGRAADSAEESAVNSGRAAEAAEQSREEIAEARMMSRKGESSMSRDEYFSRLKSDEETTTFAHKVAMAAKYYKAFEFQVWTGQRYDTIEYREKLFKDAINEYFRKIQDLTEGKNLADYNASPLGLGDKNNANAIMALAVAMHEKNGLQDYVLANTQKDVEILSFYKLMEKASLRVADVEKEEIYFKDLKEYEEDASYYRDEFVELVNLRYNMLLIMGLTKISGMGESLAGMVTFLKMGISKWETRFTTLDLGQRNKVNLWLENSLKAKDLLERLGVEPRMYSDVKKRLQNMTRPAEHTLTHYFQSHRENEAQYAYFIEQLDKLLK
ncbi:MAG: hypothetical protein H6621_10340 [Halobacteriovoraceae bacterium]|nr:hypothetical protein [Halobacteriovoraceae bacterium]MCB9095454.1 hypothetical protein [Halobacteriovoraceae bacterium]